MKLSELFESLSRVVYHYTNVRAARNILRDRQFELTSSIGSDIESNLSIPGYPYFLSTTRSRRGGYHDSHSSASVLFVLDGNWYNAKYKSKPVDYWNDRDPNKSFGRKHEAEDRLFSKTPSIPITGVREVHVLLKPNAINAGGYVREILLLAKKNGIAPYLYNNSKDWLNLNKTNSLKIKARAELKGATPTIRGADRRVFISPVWSELINSSKYANLSKEAKDTLYHINYDYDRNNIIQGLRTDLSNIKSPGSSSKPDRAQLIGIIKFMQAHNLKNVSEFINFIKQKWDNLKS